MDARFGWLDRGGLVIVFLIIVADALILSGHFGLGIGVYGIVDAASLIWIAAAYNDIRRSWR